MINWIIKKTNEIEQSLRIIMIEEFIPTIIEESGKDDFEQAYEFIIEHGFETGVLPIWVFKEAFVDTCLKNKDKILEVHLNMEYV